MASTKDVMIGGAIELLRERGAAGLTVDAVLERTGAPRGSVYHHFPGGRADLIAQSITVAGDAVASVLDDDDPVAALERFGRFWAGVLAASGFDAACPVMSVIVSETDGPALDLARHTLDRWTDRMESALAAAGVADARTVATTTLAAVEGGIVLARARRSTAPLDAVIAERCASIRAAVRTS